MKNIVWHDGKVHRAQKEGLLGQKSFVIWFSGLSGSGKSTIATELESRLFRLGKHTVLLDGDNVRHGLCSGLDFSIQDRQENLRRIRETSKLFYDNGTITLVSFITPLESERQKARELLGGDYIEVYVSCPLSECERRDVKGLYKRVRAGEIVGFTGIDQPYEEPQSPEITVDSQAQTLEESVEQIIDYLRELQYI